VVGNGFLDNVLLLYLPTTVVGIQIFWASFLSTSIEDGFQLCVLGSRGYLLTPSWDS